MAFKIESQAQYERTLIEIERFMTKELTEKEEERFDELVAAISLWSDQHGLDQ